jgi:fructokinase
MRRIYGFGETVLDIIFKDGQPVAAKPGGSVLNAFVSLGRLGWNPAFISEYAQDAAGDLIESFLFENGVDTGFVRRYTEGKSAIALAFLDRDNNARYSFYKDFPKQRLQELPQQVAADDILLFGSIYASSREVRQAVLRFLETGRRSGCLIVYDPNFREAHLPELDELKPRILENIEYADIIRGSDEDFRLIFGLDDPETLVERIDTRSKILICTRTGNEVAVIHNSRRIDLPVKRIEPVSTIGAGDNFNAGLVHYLLNEGISRADLEGIGTREIRHMVETGIRFASHVCLHYDNYISSDFAGSLIKK